MKIAIRLVILIYLVLIAKFSTVLASSGTDSKAAPSLPPFSEDIDWRLRGAQMAHWLDWSDPSIWEWSRMDRFPQWGGNAIRIFLEPSFQGQTVLPGASLSRKLEAALNRYSLLIDWAMRNNIYVIVNFNPYPYDADDWPDDGRSLWKDESARLELVDAWAEIAKRFAGQAGFIFDLVNEPHGISDDEIEGNHNLPKQVWNSLYPRLVNAIRAEDSTRWIVVTPIWGDPGNFPDLSVYADPKLIYAFHYYFPHYFTHQGIGSYPAAESVDYPGFTTTSPWESEVYWNKTVLEERLLPAINFMNTHSVRMMCGEFGSNSFAPEDSQYRWTNDLVALLEKHDIDHLYFYYDASDRVWPGSWTFENTSFQEVVTDTWALNIDTDHDGTPDGIDLDDDNDGMSDEFEETHSLDSLDSGDAALDADSDGDSNLAEFKNNTDPRDPLSNLASRQSTALKLINLLNGLFVEGDLQ